MDNKFLKVFYYYDHRPVIKEGSVKELYKRDKWVGTTLLGHEELHIIDDAKYIEILLNIDILRLNKRKYTILHREMELGCPRELWIELEEIIDESQVSYEDKLYKCDGKYGYQGEELEQLDSNEINFVNEFIKDFDGHKAALRAGYQKETASKALEKLLSLKKIIKAIEEAKFNELRIK